MRYALSTLVGGALMLAGATTAGAVTVEGNRAATTTSRPSARELPPSRTYSLLQMNLCLSGFASCFERYPRVVKEAIGVVRSQRPDAVAFNEVCSRDVARIARATGYHDRFAPVRHHGRPLRCVRPGARGVFGNAVMTRQAVRSADQAAFTAQEGIEERRWICVETARHVSVCSTHLSTRHSPAARRANDLQCTEFAAVLASRHGRGRLIAAGDVNRRQPCAPAGVWTRIDARASQLAGRQHGYGGGRRLQPLAAELVRATHTDHDYLLVNARKAPLGRGSVPTARATF